MCVFQDNLSSTTFLREDFRNLLILSTKPFAHGAVTATKRCLILREDIKSENSEEVKAVPLSETKNEGLPRSLKI